MMADRKQPLDGASCKRGSNRTRPFSHLKPLSVYARSVFCKAASSCSVSLSWNLKVEFTNSRASVGRKVRLDDSCLDDEYDTPLKKPCLSNGSSPDSACDLDFRQVKLVSPPSSSAVLDSIKRIDQTLSDHESLGLGWFDCIEGNNGQSTKSFPAVHSSSPVILHHKGRVDGIADDYHVDEIMCLSPIDGPDGLEDFIQSSLGKVSQTESDEGYVTKSFDKADSKDMTESEITKSEMIAVKAPAQQQLEKIEASVGQRNITKDSAVIRPVALYREKEWEKERKAYVNSVTRHITENGEAGVMTELLHLMNTVANQGRGSDGRKWQHPSDLTRRNYRLRNSSRLLSLDEWQNMNYRYHRRFAKVPQVFKRSPVL